ncbi:flagellar biosynthetic protein FliO [Rhizobium sp. PL01]|uniref:flagellar biosynthetic protein FliO n=1 Tax=Rhizobium sp. PL01 TaxID=3085631 RepID=UPI002982AD0D|nr:flagellar biosynthetic protein FliO [Rhizobium sp. PL01]MDW5313502.1 flagellar biosynthetic protein FliO [Rhizobium sp. PL01]
MIEDIVGNNGSRFIIAAGAVALGLLCLVAVLRFMRNRPSSPFIRGGKNRQPRLAVLDAAAIDTRRRLVLVRRDDVEHLIMIGGPTDVVIESRIASATQPQLQTAIAQPPADAAIAARPVVDRSIAERPIPERRIAPQADVKLAPVSAMGQALYGESADISTPPARTAQPVQTRADAVTPRQALPERNIPVQAQVRPQTVASSTPPPVSLDTARSPEDILDAARSRVLAANQSVTAERPLPQAVPVAAGTQTQTIQGQPDAQARKDESALEFERILDAQITGDLGKLSANPVRVDSEVRANTAVATPAIRQEPRLGSAQGSRTEPSLEDEMNRMLNEITANRKN